MEQSNIQIRLANISDVEQINSLLQRNAPQYLRDHAYWLWIHRLIGCDSSISVVADIGQKIIGHYAIIPTEIWIKEKVYPAGLGIHALVDKQYNVSILDISKMAYEEAEKKGLKFIYGFPNKNYRLIQEKLERWKKIALFNAYEFSSNIETTLPENLTCVPVENNYDSLFNLGKLLELGYKNKCNRIKKNIQYYYFRYLNHPQKLYDVFFIYLREKLVGCLFMKKFIAENGDTRLHLVDFLRTEDLSYSQIIQFCKYYANQAGIKSISIWPIHVEFEQELNVQGFAPVGFDTFFGIKLLDNEWNQQDIFNFENWELMMGDSDAI